MITDVVPQRSSQCEDDSTDSSGDSEVYFRCDGNDTLEYSITHGVVITNILSYIFPNLTQIQPLVALSLLIAFITLGSGYLDAVSTFARQLAGMLVPDAEHVSVRKIADEIQLNKNPYSNFSLIYVPL